MRLPRTLRAGVIAWMPDGQAWADTLPALLERARERWQLRVGEPFEGGCTAWVAPAERADGSACVLKLPYPDDESRHEPEALRLWHGEGAVRLIEQDDATRALLLERVSPGTSLLDLRDPDAALAVACGALSRLWVAAPGGHPFPAARARAAHWAVDVERRFQAQARPFDAALVRAAGAVFGELAGYEGEEVVLHQDFHRGNVLRAEREPWLVIDPKPLAGERAFDVHWLLRDLLCTEPRAGRSPGALLDRLAEELAVDAERIRLWSLARAVENALWCNESGEAADDDLALARALC